MAQNELKGDILIIFDLNYEPKILISEQKIFFVKNCLFRSFVTKFEKFHSYYTDLVTKTSNLYEKIE